MPRGSRNNGGWQKRCVDMAAYCNEITPFAAVWLRGLIRAGLIVEVEQAAEFIETVMEVM